MGSSSLQVHLACNEQPLLDRRSSCQERTSLSSCLPTLWSSRRVNSAFARQVWYRIFQDWDWIPLRQPLSADSQAGGTGQSKKCGRRSEKASIQLSLACSGKSGNIRMIVFLTARVWISLWCCSEAQMHVVLLKQKCDRSCRLGRLLGDSFPKKKLDRGG